MITTASPAAQKIGYSALKPKQMDVVMRIMGEHDVFTTTLITRYGKGLCYSQLPYTYDEALLIFSITSSRYRIDTAKTADIQYLLLQMYNYVHPSTTVMQVLCSLEIQWHKSLMRVSHDLFPIFEGGVRQSRLPCI